ncbi:endochitinase A-like [Arachis ipaensis]|uniref:endochitinase A-like n=1 Tax=Arachis ipaensis TaxID=130454 RepID=UPI0007AF8E7A|nr:endochitinase A-like [Arachis ipaensis]XP_025652139.1 endochitinase A-like [Arachis hypogaea]
MDSQLGLHSSSTPDVTAATSSSTTVAAITTTTTVPVTTLTIGVTTSSLFPASTIATAVATSASGGASAIPVSSLQEEDDDDVHVVDPLPLVANVSQFYNNNGTLRALNPDVETTALWRSQTAAASKKTKGEHVNEVVAFKKCYKSKQSSKSRVEAKSHSGLGVDPSGIETEVTQPPPRVASYTPLPSDAKMRLESGHTLMTVAATSTFTPDTSPTAVKHDLEPPFDVPALENGDLDFEDLDFDV